MRSRTVFILSAIGVLVFTSVVQAEDTRGTPGVDYPNYFTLPETSFKCSEQKYNPGFYADLETKCQAFHFCYEDRQESFLCPTGTIFNQAVLTCDLWHKSNCSLAPLFYSANEGPVMERAGRNLPMLLRLRNRFQNKPTPTSSNGELDKVSSLHEAVEKAPDTNTGIHGSTETKVEADKTIDGSTDLKSNNGEKSPGSIKEFDSDSVETYETKLTDENDETETDEEMDTNIVYDPVTEGYYRKYDQYDAEWQNLEPASEEFNNFYDYRNTLDEYGSEAGENEVNDYGESYGDSDLTIAEDSEYPEFTKRASRRVRRKPVYVVLDSELDNESEKEKFSKKLNEFSDSLISSTSQEAKNINLNSEESVDITRYGTPLAPIHVQSENQDTSPHFEQTDDQAPDSDDTIYIENDMEPESSIPYGSQYEDVVLSDAGEAYEESYSDSSDHESDSEYEDMVLSDAGEAYEESYSDSSDQESDSEDMEDTFVVIPDEYDNVVDSDSNENLEMADYPDENLYRTEMFATGSPSAAYSNYESYQYSSNMNYPGHYEQTYSPVVASEIGINQRWPEEFYQSPNSYPEMGAVYPNTLANDHGSSYQSGYEFQGHVPVSYGSSNLDTENSYAHTEQYPYTEAELGVTDSPLQLPVTEADLEAFSTEDLNEVAGSERDPFESPEYESNEREDVFYVFDFDEEQSSEVNETESVKDQNMEPEGPFPAENGYTDQENENKQLNSSNNASTSMSNEHLDTESKILESTTMPKEKLDSLTSTSDKPIEMNDLSPNLLATSKEEHSGSEGWSSGSLKITRDEQPYTDVGWSSDTYKTRDEPTKTPDVNSYSLDTNPMNNFPGSNLGGQSVPPAHESSSSMKTPFSSNMGNFDFSTDSRFLNNMGFSDSMDFGPYGFGPNMGQFSMMESVKGKTSNGYSQRTGPTEPPKLSPLSAIQEKMRSMKQGKFGAFKKYMSSN